jgi:hypothetical protein
MTNKKTKLESTENPKLLYIVGRGHSGSTLLELLLDRSPNFSAMGELSLFNLQLSRTEESPWIGRCSCGKRVAECPYWLTIIHSVEEKFGKNVRTKPFSWRVTDVGKEEDYGWKAPLSMLRYLCHRIIRRTTHRVFDDPPLLYKMMYRQWFENRAHLARKYAEITHAQAVIDASKDPVDLQDFLSLTDLPIKILFITRNVKGVAASTARRTNLSPVSEAHDWVRVNTRIIRALDKYDTNDWIQVKYEDLCADPNGTLNRIADFAEVEADFSGLSLDSTSRHTIAGNGLRFKEINEVRPIDNDHQILTEHELIEIEQISNRCSKKLGY